MLRIRLLLVVTLAIANCSHTTDACRFCRSWVQSIAMELFETTALDPTKLLLLDRGLWRWPYQSLLCTGCEISCCLIDTCGAADLLQWDARSIDTDTIRVDYGTARVQIREGLLLSIAVLAGYPYIQLYSPTSCIVQGRLSRGNIGGTCPIHLQIDRRRIQASFTAYRLLLLLVWLGLARAKCDIDFADLGWGTWLSLRCW